MFVTVFKFPRTRLMIIFANIFIIQRFYSRRR
jgi:hypothetical protein